MADKFSDERRSFLKTIALVGGVAASLPMIGKAQPAERKQQPLSEETAQGYRETEHISKYYQTAKD